MEHGSNNQLAKGSEIVGMASVKTARILFREKPALMDDADEYYLRKSDSMVTAIFRKTIH